MMAKLHQVKKYICTTQYLKVKSKLSNLYTFQKRAKTFFKREILQIIQHFCAKYVSFFAIKPNFFNLSSIRFLLHTTINVLGENATLTLDSDKQAFFHNNLSCLFVGLAMEQFFCVGLGFHVQIHVLQTYVLRKIKTARFMLCLS